MKINRRAFVGIAGLAVFSEVAKQIVSARPVVSVVAKPPVLERPVVKIKYPLVPNKRIIKAYHQHRLEASGQLMLNQVQRYQRYLQG